jgi:hypothetical protein
MFKKGELVKYGISEVFYSHPASKYPNRTNKSVKIKERDYTVTIIKVYPECCSIQFKGGGTKIVNNKYLKKLKE